MVSAPKYKKLGSYHFPPYYQIKLDKLETNDFSCIHHKTEVTGQPITLKCGER